MSKIMKALSVLLLSLLTVAVAASEGPVLRTSQDRPEGSGAAAGPTRERVEQRVEQFWKAWQMRNLHQVYLLFAPSYRANTTETAFYEVTRGMLNITPVKYSIEKIEITPDKRHATAQLNATSVIMPFGEVPNKFAMDWVYEEGDWYREMKPPEVITVPRER